MKKTISLFAAALFMLFANLSAQVVDNKDLLPPAELQATISNQDVSLTWAVPGSGGWLRWDSGDNADGIGLTGGGQFYVAARFTNAELAAYNDMNITKVKLFLRDADATYKLMIWKGANAANQVTNQDITSPVANEWSTIDVVTPIAIDAAEEYWIGYHVEHGADKNPAGCDAGPAVQNFGDMISMDGSAWESMGAAYGLDYNWNIEAYASAGKGGKDATAIAKSVIDSPSTSGLERGFLAKPANSKSGAKALLGYNVYRDDTKINASTVADANYEDLNVAEGAYTYHVTAVYDEGESEKSNTVDVAILLNMIDRNMVIMEVGTGTWCQYCPGAALGADDFIANGKDVAVIEYHNGDNYVNDQSNERLFYYNIESYPTAIFNGTEVVAGGNHTQSLYANYLPIYETQKAIKSAFKVEMSGDRDDNNNCTVEVKVERVGTMVASDLVLHIAATESEISENWQGQSELNFVCRDLYPSANGSDLDFSSEDVITISVDLTLDNAWNSDHVEFVAFVQDPGTKIIKQGAKLGYDELIPVGVEDLDAASFRVFPNPASDVVNVEADSKINSVSIYNYAGATVYSAKVNELNTSISTSDLAKGVYLIKIETENGMINKKLIIQ